MAFIPTLDTVECRLQYLLENQQCENTLWFQASAAVTIPNMENLGAALATWWATQIAPAVSDALTLERVVVIDQNDVAAPTATYVPSSPVPGENDSPHLPNSNSLSVSFRTAGRGRSSRGRNYVVGLCEDQTTGSVVDAGVTDFFQDAYAQLIGAGDFVAGWQWVVVSKFTEGNARTAGLAQPVTSVVVVDPVIDSQRRRLPGRGR